ncbi:unnamed protein product [Brassica oleracea]
MDENITMRLFANDRNNIRCGNMQTEIDTYKYIYRGQATFNVQLLMESTESWEPGTVILKRSGPLIKQQRRSCASKRNTQRAPGTGRTQKRTSLDWHNNNNKGTTLAMCKQYV